jgi:hypothetical protein
MRQAYFRDGRAEYNDLIWWPKGATWKNQSPPIRLFATSISFPIQRRADPWFSTGRSCKHIPFFRVRLLGFVLFDGRWSFCGMSIVAHFLSYKQRPSCAREDTLPNGISWASPAVNHCFAHGTRNHASDRCCRAHHCHNGLLPLRVAR